MEIQLEQILGLWRHQHDVTIIDFYVRLFDERIDRGLSFFTVYSISEQNSNIGYEWQGIPEIINHEDEISDIVIHRINCSENDTIYQDLKIWRISEISMTLQLGDGSRIEFQKLRV